MARCPSCDDALSATVHDGVQVALCNDCGATWATFEQLKELNGGPVDSTLLPGKTRHRCATCQVTLSRARLFGGTEVEVCTTCRGVFFPEGALSKFRPLKGKNFAGARLAGTFECVTCFQRFPMSQGTARGAGLACRKCAGLEGDTPGYNREDAADAAVDWFVEDPGRIFRYAKNAFWVVIVLLILIGGYCGTTN